MKLKKLTAMLCTAAMILSIISLPAAASAETTPMKGYIAYDTFDDGTTGGWVEGAHGTLTFAEGTTPSDTLSVVTNPTIGGIPYEGGFLKFASNATNVSDADESTVVQLTAYRDFNDVEFTGSNKIFIKTKVYQEAANPTSTGRFDLRLNRPNVHPQLSGLNDHQWLQYGIFRQQSNKVSYAYSIGHQSIGANYVNNGTINNMAPANKWVEYTIELDGKAKTTKITAVVDGTPYTATGLLDFAPAIYKDIYGDDVNLADCYVKALESFTFKNTSAEAVYIDYFKVWQTGVRVTDATAIADLRNVNVKFTSNVTLSSDIADYVTLYESDGETEVAASKSYDAATQTVKFTSAVDFTPGTVYKVKFDAAGAETDMLYTWEAPAELNVEAPACAALNLTIKGELAPGTDLEADYDLMPEGSVEGASEFIWYTVAADGTKTEIEGETGKFFSITDETYVDSTITYSVKPQCVVGTETKNGVWTDCTVTVTPLSAPVASNPKFSTIGAMVGETLSAIYDYFDADGDVEDGTVITWYKSATEDFSDYTDFATGETIHVTEDLNGMYIRFTVAPKNNALFRDEGEPLWSDVIGPASDVITASNLFVNPGFESGEITPWTASVSETYKGVEVTDADAYRGTYSMRAHPRNSVNPSNGQKVSLEAGKMYIVSAMVKSASGNPHVKFEGQVSGGSMYRPYRDAEYTDISPDEWVRVTLTIAVNTSADYTAGFKSDHDLAADAYIDDAYIGELRIGSVGTKEIAPVVIPKGDEIISFPVLDGKIYNQFGETDGLTGQTVTLSIEDTPGVSIVNDQVVIDKNAVAGTAIVKAKVVPRFNYNINSGVKDKPADFRDFTCAQAEFVQEIPIELVAHDDKTPVAKNVDATGTVAEGNTLTGYYEFYQVDGKANASARRWLYSDTIDGAYTAIPGATGMTYVVGSTYKDKFIKFEVTPKTEDGLVGTAVSSVALAIPTAPYAENVVVNGVIKVGETLTTDYDFVDVNRDNQGDTKFQWYVSDTADGDYSAIDGAETESLELTADLTDKYIKFGVTPVSEEEPAEGDEAFSKALLGPTVPVAKDVSITVEGNRLIGNYTYYHPHNARELKSIYKWTVDGNEVSDDTNYVASFAGTKTVTFTVTPVGDTNPGTGESVSASVTIRGSSGNVGGNTSAGGGGGGGFGGGGSGSIAAGVTSINGLDYGEELTKPEDTENQEPVSDLDGHWGADYIKKMEERGVMGADENGNYNPDELVSRENMLTYLFKTLKLEASEYTGIFGDVADGEFAGMLQTMVDNGTIAVDDNFRPGDSISREEMCKILFISLDNAGKLVEEVEDKISGFSDYSEISEWAVHYVNSIYAIKIMIGVSDDRFAPQENVTKAQAATMLTRIISWVEGE